MRQYEEKRSADDPPPLAGRGWAAAALRHRGLVLLLGLALTAAAVSLVARLELDTDLAGLLPAGDPAVEAYLRSQELFAAEALILLLENLEGEIDPALGERLAELAAERPLLATASPAPFLPRGLASLLGHGVQLLPPEARPELVERLGAEGMERAAGRLRRRLVLPLAPGAGDLLRHDPLGLIELLPRPALPAGQGWRLEQGVLLSADGRALVVFADLAGGKTDEPTLRLLLDEIEGLRGRLREELAAQGLNPDAYLLRATGPAVIAAEEARLLRREALTSFAGSLALVVLFFAAAFRRAGAFLWLTLPLGGAVCVTLVVGEFAFSRLSFLAASAAVPMVGLGIDFGIHVYSRALDRAAEGLSPRAALAAALEEVTGANLAAAATTGLAFGSLALSAIPGLRQMGLVSILGLLLSLAAMTFFFPSLLLATGALAPRRGRRPRVPGRYLEPWLGAVIRHPGAAAAFLLVASLAAISQLPRITFGEGSYESRIEVNPALGAQEEVLERFGSHFRLSLVMLRGRDPAALDLGHRRALAAAEELRRAGVISAVLSPFAWLPERAEQRRNLAAAREAGDPRQVTDRLRRALERAGLDPRGFAPGLASLEQALAEREPLSLDAIGRMPELADFVERFWRRHDGWIHGAIFFLAADPNYGETTYQALEEGFGGVSRPSGVDIDLVTPRLLSRAVRGAARREIGPAAGLALLAVVVVLGIALRRPVWVALAVLPLAIATLWLLGVVGATGLALSIENIAALPLIIGIGIDDALHVLHHLRRHPERALLEVLRESGKAVALTTATTVLAFATLAFAGHPALRSLGILTGLGVTFCLVTTLTVIPLSARFFPGARPRRGGVESGGRRRERVEGAAGRAP